MRQKRIQQSKSKSQTHRHSCNACEAFNILYGASADDVRAIGDWEWPSTTRKRPLQPLSEPEACEDIPLVHIGFHNARWHIAEGHVWSLIQDKAVAEQSDPVVVAVWLISHANGKINVAW